MKRLPILLLLALTACSRRPSVPASLAGPTPVNADVVYDSSVEWDAMQLGHVWVTNPSPLFPLKLTLVVHRYISEENQPIAALSPLHVLNAGEVRREITAGVEMQCGTTYQRDLYTGGPWSKGDTLAELRNYFYAGGGLWKTAPCGSTPSPVPPAPPVPPPAPPRLTCADEGLTLTKLPRVPGPALLGQAVAVFTIGPATMEWNDGSAPELLRSGVTASHVYHSPNPVSAIVTTTLGCSASVVFVF